MTTFRSKLGREIIIPIAIILAGLGSLMVYQKIWEGLTVIACVVIFIIFIFLTTYYQIDGRILKIRCGVFSNLKIDIDTIRRMSETNNPISSPAFSLDRLEIKYQKERKIDTVMISPKDKDGFIKMITQLNPTIELRLKPLN
ncbi:MAG: PH domain-containing protein [Prolixibacteraceae bacterium]|nr:PH domain-containing protein [Prolixibacteraceae bacterium]